MDLERFQQTIRETYGAQDRERGLEATFSWFVEEVGELSRALFRQGPEEREHEFADVLAWLVTLADLADVDMAAAAERYRHGCPKCGASPCTCRRPVPEREGG
ncbi:MAG: MazG nucleotide pyrophosphohydrolase domain-containing protein [Nitriliruptorales bacterium]|nr:MazG nucleotide pyrophosphohydrolase domain-containing protein [Nitriliruptorales bacterium]